MDLPTFPLEMGGADSILRDQQAEQLAGTFDKLGAAGKREDREALKKAAEEFEGYFISYMLKVMRETVPEGPFDSQAANQFFTFYDQELGRLAAARGGFGLAALLLEQQGIQQGGGTSQSLSSSGSDRPIPDTSR